MATLTDFILFSSLSWLFLRVMASTLNNFCPILHFVNMKLSSKVSPITLSSSFGNHSSLSNINCSKICRLFKHLSNSMMESNSHSFDCTLTRSVLLVMNDEFIHTEIFKAFRQSLLSRSFPNSKVLASVNWQFCVTASCAELAKAKGGMWGITFKFNCCRLIGTDRMISIAPSSLMSLLF